MSRLNRDMTILFLLGFCPSVHAAFEQRDVGARALGTGGAFVAGEDDVLATLWNPAALTTLETKELEFSYQDLYSKGLVNFTNLSFGYPQAGPGAFGIAWTRMGVSNKVPFNYSENTYTVAYGLKIYETLSLGTALNYYRLSSAIKGSGFGANLGLRARFWNKVTLGGLYQNALRTTVRYDSGAEDDLPNDLRFGGAFEIGQAIVYADLNRLLKRPHAHAGLELIFFEDALRFRGGFSRQPDKNLGWVYALGFGVKMRSVGLDYAFESHFDLGPSHIVSVKWRF